MSIIEVNSVTKEFKLGQLKSLKHTMLNAFDHLRGKEVEKLQPFKALDDVSFTVEPGEVLGIIGQNGAGKSTLLKLLARISKPTRGEVKVKGSVAPLIEVGAGMIGDLTGRENVYVNGAILGLSQAEIKKKFDDIVAFAELEQFIDTPIKRYSSGMAIRLAFSIATSVNSDILIVDEVLAVGDLAFQRKCFDRIEKLIKKEDKTILIVSHNIRQIQRLCSRVILIGKGKVLSDGDASSVCDKFFENSNMLIKEMHQRETRGLAKIVSSGEIEFKELKIYDNGSNKQTETVRYLSPIKISVYFKANTIIEYPDIIVGFHTTDFYYISTMTSATLSKKYNVTPGEYVADFDIDSLPLNPGVYCIRVGFVDKYHRVIWHGEGLKTFIVSCDDANVSKLDSWGFVSIPFKTNLNKISELTQVEISELS